jgi:hypothetical protein
MPIRISSTVGFLNVALTHAREGGYEKALPIVKKIEKKPLSSDCLRKLALVHSYGGQLSASEACWIEVERRNEMKSGDFFMLGSLQVGLSKADLAIRSLEKELLLASTTTNQFFLVSSVVTLSHLLIQKQEYKRATSALDLIASDDGDFVPSVGYRTKADLLSEISRLQ